MSRTPWAALGLLLSLLSGCQFDATPAGATRILCSREANRCADLGLECRAGYCTPADVPFTVTVASVSPELSSGGGRVTVTLAISGTRPEVLDVSASSGEAVLAFSEVAAGGDAFEATVPVEGPAGVWRVKAVGRDLLGHADGDDSKTFTVDVRPPVISDVQWIITRPDLPQVRQRTDPATAVTFGSTVQVSWFTDEPVSDALATVRLLAPPGAPSDGLELESIDPSGFGTLHRFIGTIPPIPQPDPDSGVPQPVDAGYQGALEVRVHVEDPAGNAVEAVAPLTILRDTVRPSLPMSALSLLRRPYGDRANLASRTELLVAAGAGTEPGLAVAYRLDALAGSTSIGKTAYSPDAGSALLLVGDFPLVAVQLVDMAGNFSQVSAAAQVELVLLPSVLDPDKQWLEQRRVLSDVRQVPAPGIVPPRADGGWSVSAVARWASVGRANTVNQGTHLIYDSERGRVVAWGGTLYEPEGVEQADAQELDDFYELLGGGWLKTFEGPRIIRPVGLNVTIPFGVVYDPLHARILRYDGKSGVTERHDGSRWLTVTTPANGAAAPDTRREFSLTYMPPLGVVLLFGGRNGTSYFGDLWALGQNTWEKLDLDPDPAAGVPMPRALAAFGSVFGNGVVIAGGKDPTGHALNDVWRMKLSSWQKLAPLANPMLSPVLVVIDEPNLPALLFDPGNGKAYVLGGGGFDAAPAWDAPVGATAGVYDAASTEVVLTGAGVTARRRLDESSWRVMSYDGLWGDWVPGAVVYEPAFGELLAYGGLADGGALAETWCRTREHGWSRVAAAGPPPLGATALAAFDGGIALYGGTPSGGGTTGERWVYAPTARCAGTWSDLGPTNARSHHVATSSALGAYFAGGLGGVGTAEWYDGARWISGTTMGGLPTTGVGNSIAYDWVRKLFVSVGGGSSQNPIPTATSADGSAWTTGPPLGRLNPAAVFDHSVGRVLVYGGTAPTVGPLAAADVVQVSAAGVSVLEAIEPDGTGPGERTGHYFVYDAQAERSVVVGGTGTGFLWELAASGQRPALLYHVALDDLVTSPSGVSYERLDVNAVAGGSARGDGASVVAFTAGHFFELGRNGAGTASPAALSATLADKPAMRRMMIGQKWLTVGVSTAEGSGASGGELTVTGAPEVHLHYSYARLPNP